MLWLQAPALTLIQVGSAQCSMAGEDTGLGHREEWSLMAPSHEIFQLPAGPKPSWGPVGSPHVPRTSAGKTQVTVQVGLAVGCLGLGSCSTSHQPCVFTKPRARSQTQCSPL